MIDPKEFVKVEQKVEQEVEQEDTNVTGTFICQECFEPVGFAVLNEDSMQLVYTCAAGHRNEATL